MGRGRRRNGEEKDEDGATRLRHEPRENVARWSGQNAHEDTWGGG